MARNAPADGLRDLSLIRESGSTARVLNLALIFERAGESEDFIERPLFRSARLNRALILKHAVRPHERALFDSPEPHTTKIVFPYSSSELELGGTSVMMGERGFEQALRAAIGDDAESSVYEDDFDLLCILHDAPSFDPFLLREQLRRVGRAPARCFFDLSEADVGAMQNFVAEEIAPLIGLALGAGGRRAEKLAQRLAEKLMTDESAQVLEPLRAAVKLPPAQYREGVFAWKGFLYYKWLLRDLITQHDAFTKAFLRCSTPGADAAPRAEIDALKREIFTRSQTVLVRASAAVRGYDKAFDGLIEGHPTMFRDFLLQGPSLFVALGEAVGAVKHMHSLWGFRFREGVMPSWEAGEALETLREFSRMLAGIEFTRAEPETELAL